MKAVSDKLKADGKSDEDIKTFQKGASAGVKRILGSFKDYDLYINEDYDPTGMLIAVNYREDGVTPYAIVWKYGFTEYKV